MTDDFATPARFQGPTADLPLRGQTILVVEDSRLASEALRLMCYRSGARIRRADCLRAAQRHLQTYRPAAIIVDMGLPDGNGADLIAMIRAAPAGALPVIGLSGDPDLAGEALNAGADRFLTKPIASLALFQRTVLELLKQDRPAGEPSVDGPPLPPDPAALADDLSHAAALLDRGRPGMSYAARFLAGVARDAHDEALHAAARALSRDVSAVAALSRARGLLEARLATMDML